MVWISKAWLGIYDTRMVALIVSFFGGKNSVNILLSFHASGTNVYFNELARSRILVIFLPPKSGSCAPNVIDDLWVILIPCSGLD